MKTVLKIGVYLLILMFGEIVVAGSITCRGHIIEDDTLEPVLKSTVRQKCGEPETQKLGGDLYKMPNGTSIVVRYNASQEVQSIEEVSK